MACLGTNDPVRVKVSGIVLLLTKRHNTIDAHHYSFIILRFEVLHQDSENETGAWSWLIWQAFYSTSELLCNQKHGGRINFRVRPKNETIFQGNS